MKILFAAHNHQGYLNIKPLIDKAIQDEMDYVLLDLTSLYGQKKLPVLDREKYIFEQSKIYRNIRNLNNLNKLIYKIFSFNKLRFYSEKYDILIFSPGGFYEGMLSNLMFKMGKQTYFIEAGIKIYLFLDSQKELEPKPNFLSNINNYFCSGELSKKMLKSFVGDEGTKIINYGVPRYQKLVSNKRSFSPGTIKELLFLTSASEYHRMQWEHDWQIDFLEELVKKLEDREFILKIKVHPRDASENYLKYQNRKNVSILDDTDIDQDILQSDIILAGPSTSLHESSFFGKIYLSIWPLGNEGGYFIEESHSSNVDELMDSLYDLNSDYKRQKEIYDLQHQLALKYIHSETDNSASNIYQHIVRQN